MPILDHHPPGNFCWLELATTDQSSAKTFYCNLFGWHPNDSPMGPGQTYTMFELNGRNAAAAFSMGDEERASGIPPHWQLYIAVEDADTASARAAELGGKIVVPAMDVQDYGRMAVFQDPAGAHFSVWQSRTHPGFGIAGEANAFSWADLVTTDRKAAIPFYTSLFGWEFLPGEDKDPEGYLHIRNGEQFIGGVPPTRTLPPGVPCHWLPYVKCPDCEAQTTKAHVLGGRLLVPPTLVEGQLRFTVLSDAQGAVFALFTPAHK